jgi:uncharacterized membrane protein YdjX (TVP38/TMEM64 family)
MMNKSYKVRVLLLLAIPISLLYVLVSKSTAVQGYLSNPDTLKQLLLSFGILAPLAIIFIQAFQGLVSIFPSQITTIVSGFIFGPIFGLIYSLIGATLGSFIAFFISRRYGKSVALKIFTKRNLVHFNMFFKEKKLAALFVARIIPLFPNDLISFAAGLTNIKWRDFIFVSTTGFIFQMIILTYFGAELATGTVSVPVIVIAIVLVLLLVVVLFRNKIKEILIEDLCELKKEGKKIEEAIEKEFKSLKLW